MRFDVIGIIINIIIHNIIHNKNVYIVIMIKIFVICKLVFGVDSFYNLDAQGMGS